MIERPATMSRLALGCYPIGGGYGTIPYDQAHATVDAALESGLTFLDTAEVYLDSEERLGLILQHRRDRVFLATKAYPCESYSYEHLAAALEGSLRRLRTDHVDLYQLHGPEDWVLPLAHTPLDELAGALDRLKQSGKALHVGVCNFPGAALEALAARTEIFSTQNLCSLIDRDGDRDGRVPLAGEVIPYARRHGVAVLAYSPLARGLLADEVDPHRRFPPNDERYSLRRFQPGAYEHYAALQRRLSGWAADHGHTLVELAVAWTLNQDGVASTLVGAKSPDQVRALAQVDQLTLGTHELAELEEIVASPSTEAREERPIDPSSLPTDWLDAIRHRRYGALADSTPDR